MKNTYSHRGCAVITGASSGIGLAVAKSLAQAGFSVIGIGRSETRNEAARQEILSAVGGADVAFFAADLMQQREVNNLAKAICRMLESSYNGQLEILVNNAGCIRSWYMTTSEGYEQQLALNHLAGFLLSFRLMKYLKRAQGRILFTASQSHKGMRVRWRDIMFSRRYRPLRAYKQSKLCNVLTARELLRRFAPYGVGAYAVDPGLIKTEIGNKETAGVVDFVWRLRKKSGHPLDEAAESYLYLATETDLPPYFYFRDSKPCRPGKQANEKNAARLFALSAQLCGIAADSEGCV